MILCIGECMAELAPLDAPGTYRMGFAGDTFDMAWYLARLGLRAGYLSAVGDDPTSRRMRAFMEAAGACDIALPSHDDEATWFGDADPAATAARYAEAGAGTVVVKDGAGAVLWRQGGETGTVPVTPVEAVVDSTAAGDSFNAGLMTALSRGAPLPEAIAAGCRLSARVVQGRGALVPVDAA